MVIISQFIHLYTVRPRTHTFLNAHVVLLCFCIYTTREPLDCNTERTWQQGEGGKPHRCHKCPFCHFSFQPCFTTVSPHLSLFSLLDRGVTSEPKSVFLHSEVCVLLPGDRHSSVLKSWGLIPMSRTWGSVRDSACLGGTEENRHFATH